MESEKVKEIKKALERNANNGVSYFDSNYVFHGVKNSEILTLINELESENERLSNRKSIYIQEILDQRDEFEKQCVGWVEIYQKKEKENQQLKDENERLTKELTEVLQGINKSLKEFEDE